MKYNDLINEFLDLLDKQEDIIKIKKLKQKLLNDQELLNSITDYQLYKTVKLKEKLYNNKDYKEYLKLESNINLLILLIKQKFNFNNRMCIK